MPSSIPPIDPSLAPPVVFPVVFGRNGPPIALARVSAVDAAFAVAYTWHLVQRDGVARASLPRRRFIYLHQLVALAWLVPAATSTALARIAVGDPSALDDLKRRLRPVAFLDDNALNCTRPNLVVDSTTLVVPLAASDVPTGPLAPAVSPSFVDRNASDLLRKLGAG